MNLLDRLERKLGRFAIPHLTIGLILFQVVAYALIESQNKQEIQWNIREGISLIPEKVMDGEIWRLGTFLFVPPSGFVVYAFFFWYLFYLMGNALEIRWGIFRYNVYLLIGYLATVGVAFLHPDIPASNVFLEGTVFLAFAMLYPDFELYIFFILPVKIKWFALITWIGYLYGLITGDWETRLLILASVSNFLLFFHRDIIERIRIGRRRMAMQAAHYAIRPPEYFHRCVACGITDRTDPTMEFRYCSKCLGNCGYCSAHLHDHQHVVESDQHQ